MNRMPGDESRWSKFRWVGMVAAIFILQILFLGLFSNSELAPPLRTAPGTRFTFGPLTPEMRGPSEIARGDPTLFALPHPQGFSEPLWRHAPPLDYQLTNSPPPPRWLQPAPQRFGETFSRFVQEAMAADFSSPDPPPAPQGALALPSGPVRTGSQLRLSGEISSRNLLNPPKLPLVHHNQLLTNTVVRITVTPEGESLPILLSGSGSKQADEIALRAARASRFEPLDPDGPIMSGQMIFEWSLPQTPPSHPPKTQP